VIVSEGSGTWREYIGGYTDWERVRATVASASAKAAAKSAASQPKAEPRPAAAAPKQKKLSYKEQRELEELPVLIASLETEQKEISEKLADPSLYKQQPDEVQRLNRRFAEIDGLLMESLEKWEGIEARAK
jgi:ATP-binding cassette subfamily F protein uup